MILIAFVALLAAGLGYVLVPRFGAVGFLVAAFLAFAAQFGWNSATGFEGLPWSESLAFFNDSLASYFGYNAQITYRAFAGPLAALGLTSVWALKSQRT
ncbi:MAG: hypothetical protein AAGG54_01550 [Pseudomonadota bacterium]